MRSFPFSYCLIIFPPLELLLDYMKLGPRVNHLNAIKTCFALPNAWGFKVPFVHRECVVVS